MTEDGDRLACREESIKEEINKIKDDDVSIPLDHRIIRDTIKVDGKESENYFVGEISNIVSQQYLMGSRVKQAFMRVLVACPDDDNHQARKYMAKWIQR